MHDFRKPIARVCFIPFYAIVPPVVAFVFIGAFAANFHSYDLTGADAIFAVGIFHATLRLAARAIGAGHGAGRQDGTVPLAFVHALWSSNGWRVRWLSF